MRFRRCMVWFLQIYQLKNEELGITNDEIGYKRIWFWFVFSSCCSSWFLSFQVCSVNRLQYPSETWRVSHLVVCFLLYFILAFPLNEGWLSLAKCSFHSYSRNPITYWLSPLDSWIALWKKTRVIFRYLPESPHWGPGNDCKLLAALNSS